MWYNSILVWLLRSPFHRLVSGNMLALSYTGRKSGKTYVLPVSYAQHGETLWVTSQRKRTWWRNLRGGAPVRLVLRGQAVAARAEALEEETTVAAGLASFYTALPVAARCSQVRLEADGQPNPIDISALVPGKVVVRVQPES